MKRYSIIDGKPIENELGVFVRHSDMEYITDLRDEKIERLESQLASEQLRRESAEKVVDMLLGPGPNEGGAETSDICWAASSYRKLYPKDSKDIKEGGK